MAEKSRRGKSQSASTPASEKRSTLFPYAIKSFVGYLEGTQKAAHTIKNYRLDLLAFQRFLQKGDGSRPIALSDVGRDDLERFHDDLKEQGLKTNTRRRKLLTVQRFLLYLSGRNKLAADVPRRLATPHKIERIPFTVSSEQLLAAIRKLPATTVLEARNRALLWSLAETGCQVSEVTRLKFDLWTAGAEGAQLRFEGKNSRTLRVSQELFDAVQAVERLSGDSTWIFLGFNKFGSLGAPITSRGVEMLVRAMAPRLGFDELTPRTFRHSAVLRWFEEGKSRKEIQELLGLKTAYAFRIYDPLLKLKTEEKASSGATT